MRTKLSMDSRFSEEHCSEVNKKIILDNLVEIRWIRGACEKQGKATQIIAEIYGKTESADESDASWQLIDFLLIIDALAISGHSRLTTHWINDQC